MVAAPTTMELVYVCNCRQVVLLDPGSSVNYVTPAALADIMTRKPATRRWSRRQRFASRPPSASTVLAAITTWAAA